MSDWNSVSSDDDSQWMPAVEELEVVITCPDCGKQCQYLLTGCVQAYTKQSKRTYTCYTCGDGTVTYPPCDTFGLFNGQVVCVCMHGDINACTQCCSFTSGERYVELVYSWTYGKNEDILHTALSVGADAIIPIPMPHDDNEWCPLHGGKITQCIQCPQMLIDKGYQGQLCHLCQPSDTCGMHGCNNICWNSTLGRQLRSCQVHASEQFCIECKVFFQSRGKKYRCRVCNPNNLIECSSCRAGYNYGSVYMPTRMAEPKCLKCVDDPTLHGVFASSQLEDFEHMVAWVLSLVRAPVTHDAAIVICAMTYESLHPDTSKRYKISLMCRNLRKGIYAFDNNKCSLSCLVFMRRLPNEIRLKIIEMVKRKQHFISWFAAPMA
jgi:hypothetical protein